MEDELTYDDHEVEHEAGYDPVAEGLEFTPDENVVRLNDPTPAG